MDDQKSKQKLEAVRKLLGEPVFIGFSDYVLKLRRNFVALAIFIIFYQWSGVKIVNLFGLQCDEVPPYKINIFLVSFLFYTSLYYFSQAWRTYKQWGIRLSGTFENSNQIKSKDKKLTFISENNLSNVDCMIEAIQLKDIGYCHGEQSYLFSIMAQAIYANLENLKNNPEIGEMYFVQDEGASEFDFYKKRKFLTSLNILEIVKTGLERFQKGFCNFQKWQIGCFFFFDILVPVVLTCFALYLQIISLLFHFNQN
jgi:hypothetical protein